ncbi:MAG: HEAT repeat domain-containing protein, partial [Planctomycetota bacterium]|nr:HEAT repeat domain-containing protein [Planctomycetota bacterium]
AREETHPAVRAEAARALGRLKVEGAYDLLIGLLAVDSDQDVVRTGAVDGLRALGDARAVDALLPLLHYRWGKGANHVLRHHTLDAVTALLPDDRRVHAALIPLLQDPYHNMRSWAAEAAGKYGVRAAIPTLTEVSKDDWNDGVKGAARKALERLDPKAADDDTPKRKKKK